VFSEIRASKSELCEISDKLSIDHHERSIARVRYSRERNVDPSVWSRAREIIGA